MSTLAPKSKVSMAPKQDRGKVMTPGEKNACAGGKYLNPDMGECFIAGTKVITIPNGMILLFFG